jgi:very-short-patch-repair endonuclease
MKKQILYGVSNENKPIPRYEGFEGHADGSIDIRLSGVNFFEIEEELLPITWRDIFNSKLHELCNKTEIYHQNIIKDPYPFAIFDKYIDRLWAMLRNYCHPKSDAERAFFDLYCKLCLQSEEHYSLLPALIPQVYINWDSCKEQRRINEKPYIVDFVFKSPQFGTNNLVIVEIDGRSHYANYDKDNGSYILSEEKYAEHLKKDRWLRKQGFKVFRIGNSEINYLKNLPEKDKLKEFYFFFQEIFDDIVYTECYHNFTDIY